MSLQSSSMAQQQQQLCDVISNNNKHHITMTGVRDGTVSKKKFN